jgi:hypothetical protein
MHEISVTPNDICALISHRAGQVAMYTANPGQDFSIDQLKRAIAALYHLTEQLEVSLSKGKPANGAEAN